MFSFLGSFVGLNNLFRVEPNSYIYEQNHYEKSLIKIWRLGACAENYEKLSSITSSDQKYNNEKISKKKNPVLIIYQCHIGNINNCY